MRGLKVMGFVLSGNLAQKFLASSLILQLQSLTNTILMPAGCK